jgi:hypothetical protein
VAKAAQYHPVVKPCEGVQDRLSPPTRQIPVAGRSPIGAEAAARRLPSSGLATLMVLTRPPSVGRRSASAS